MKLSPIEVFINLVLCQTTLALKFHNNACKRYQDYPVWFASGQCAFNPDVLATTPSLIRKNGYNFEGYTVTTDDGYLLLLHRVAPAADDDRRHKQPIFIQHGIMSNSAIWVDKGNRSLAFFLADLGYDVWLGNLRGSTYSKGHKTLRYSQPEFWKFGLDALADNDISAQLKFVASKTGKAGSIVYVGHSMGTTLSFMYAASKTREAHTLLRGIVAMSPVVYLNDIPLVKVLLKLAPQVERTFRSHGWEGIFYQENTPYTVSYTCTLAPLLCKKVLDMFAGQLSEQFQPEDLLLFYGNWLTGVSLEQLLQYKQIVETGQFAQYDFGSAEKNYETYGFLGPNKYDLSKIKLPIYNFYGRRDAIATEENVKKLMDELGSSEKSMQVIPSNNQEYSFNHIDFLYARDLNGLLYENLAKVITEKLKESKY